MKTHWKFFKPCWSFLLDSYMFNFILRFINPLKIIFPFSQLYHLLYEKWKSKQKCYSESFRSLLIPHLFQTTKNESPNSTQHHESFQSTWNNLLCSFTLCREVSGSAVSPVEGGGDPARALPWAPPAPGPCCWSQLSCRSLTTVPQNNWIVPVPAPQHGQGLGSFLFVFLPQGGDSCPRWVTPAQHQHVLGVPPTASSLGSTLRKEWGKGQGKTMTTRGSLLDMRELTITYVRNWTTAGGVINHL